ncbi:pyrroline-5-carboxylate reductase [Fistulifera solaris]|uniref:Pyrroline-5-carboxylate reductase n=1 Tax=Fistulifera solaris TaxID=1519565 RepID=A0A1Z5JJW4_FISSO|nr:pyrroline-5-carboxylate reductase [Fistulifera solaris]|eukprot:GAX14274.1 pyrroline-5-carboxylate reductase [Fistulifera solaris]
MTAKVQSVGFIGAGMMASAVMEGLVSKNVVDTPGSIICSDLFKEALEKAAERGFKTTELNREVCEFAVDAIIIAVKPNAVQTVCRDILAVENKTAVIISIAAGVTLEELERGLPGRRVVRIMPNTPCQVGEGASCYSLGTLANTQDRVIVEVLFGAVGLIREVPEHLINAVTGLSGSGPAYVFMFIEALADGGVRAGLTRADALKLAAQTVKGAAEMVLKTETHPGVLKDQVCSPGGTTIAGCDELEKGGFRSATIQAVKAATKRSMQLGHVAETDITNKYNL